MSVSTKRTGSSTRFQSTRRRSGANTTEVGTGSDGSNTHAAGAVPNRTFGRTYLSRGFSGYRRPKRPKRKGQWGVKTWTAKDPLPNVTRPSPGERTQAMPTGTKETVVCTVQQRGGCRKSKRRGWK